MAPNTFKATAVVNGAAQLQFVPVNRASYWYETGFCPAHKNNAILNRWKGIKYTFVNSAWPLHYPVPSTYQVNLQTGSTTNERDCSMTLKTNNYYTVNSALTSVSIPFTAFPKANLRNILSISFEGFGPAHTSPGGSTTPYRFGPISFYC
jgi:hypothetical protein